MKVQLLNSQRNKQAQAKGTNIIPIVKSFIDVFGNLD